MSFSLAAVSLRAAMAGALGGAVAAVLLLSIERLQSQLWGSSVVSGMATARSLPWCLLIPTAIGALLSLMGAQRANGSLPELAETLAALRDPASQAPATRANWRPICAGILALLGGGSLGPEALVSHAVVAVSRSIWRGHDLRLSSAALVGSLGFFGSPLAGPVAFAGKHAALLWRWLPGTVAGVFGFVIFQGFRALSGGVGSVPFTEPLLHQDPMTSLLAALLGGALGCGGGRIHQGWRHWLKDRGFQRFQALTPVFTGLAIGLTLWALPLAAFSGELQLHPLLLGDWGHSPSLLLLSGCIKLLLAGLCLESGWRGGVIFPLVAGSAAIGLGFHQLLPALGDAGIWCGSVVGGCLGAVLPSPLLALVLGLTLLRGHGAEALLIGLVTSLVLRSKPH